MAMGWTWWRPEKDEEKKKRDVGPLAVRACVSVRVTSGAPGVCVCVSGFLDCCYFRECARVCVCFR